MNRRRPKPLSALTAAGRLAILDQGFVHDFFGRHVPIWYPGWKLVNVTIHDQSAHHFKKSLRYDLELKKGATRRRQSIRGNVPSLDTDWEARNSAATLSHIWARGRAAPLISRPLGYFRKLRLQLYEDLPGRQLTDLLQPGAKIAPLVRKSGAWLATLHALNLQYGKHRPYRREQLEANYFLTAFRQRWRDGAIRAAQILQTYFSLRRQFRAFVRANQRLIHGDYNFNNIITRGSVVAVIDFGNAWYFDPMYDLANAIIQLQLFTHRIHCTPAYSNSLLRAFLQGYQSRHPLRATDRDRLRMYCLWWSVQTASYIIAQPVPRRIARANYALSLAGRLNDLTNP